MTQRANDTFSVSGAGPAGLAAAVTLARAGKRVVIYEKQTDVGRRFHGDFQGLENWSTQEDAIEELARLGVEATFDHTPFKEGVFFGPDGRQHVYRSEQPMFYLVRRGTGPGTLDDGLKRQAFEAGVEIRFGEGREHLPEGGVVAQGPHVPNVIAVGYVFETDKADAVFGALSDALAPKGYAYLLIHDGRGTIASCLFDDFHNEKLYLQRTVEFFREKAGLEMQNPRRFGGMGHFALPNHARRGDLLFAGESAGFQDALWGFGLRYAMLSGHLAGRAHIEGMPALYDSLWEERLGGVLRTSIVNRFLYGVSGDRAYRGLLKALDKAHDARSWLHSHYADPPFWKWMLLPLAKQRLRWRAERACPMEGCDCTWCRCHHDAPSGSPSK